MENQILTLPQEVTQIAQNVSPERRHEILNILNTIFTEISVMEEQLKLVVVKDENDKTNMKLARTYRLAIRQKRLETEKLFDENRSIVQEKMSSYKVEDQLLLKAKQIMQLKSKQIEEDALYKEETAKRFEDEQKELKVQERILKVSKIAPELDRSNFENMTDDVFEVFYTGIEKQYKDRIEAERKIEEERIAREKAEEEAREQQRLENLRLKAEAEAREKQLAEERAKAEAERKAIEEKARKEREEAERLAQIEREKQQAIIIAEQEKARKLAEELEQKRLAEEKAKKEELARLEAEKKEAENLSKAPIKNQLSAWVNSFELPKTNVNNELSQDIKAKFEAFKKWSLTQINNI